MKLMPDYQCPLPLWGVDWWELGVTAALLDALADWQDAFDLGFDPERGWSTSEAADAWASTAEQLVALLQQELADRFELTVDLWPLEPAG